jgi:hypothetical protein
MIATNASCDCKEDGGDETGEGVGLYLISFSKFDFQSLKGHCQITTSQSNVSLSLFLPLTLTL